MKIFRELFKSKGQGVVEYALLLGVVAVIIVGITDKDFWDKFHDTFLKIVDQITKYNEAYDSSVVNNAWD